MSHIGNSDIIDSSMKLAELLPGERLPASAANTLVSSIVLDSRFAQPSSLFVALAGSVTDGRKFIGDAIERGATAVLAESAAFSTEVVDNVPVIHVENLPRKVGLIASRFYGYPSEKLSVIGVTGTNGKSTCVSLIAQIYDRLGMKAGTMGTLGYGLLGEEQSDTGMTTPDAVSCQRILRELLDKNASVVAMEVSSHGIAQHRIEGIRFQAAAFTNLTHDHLDFHNSFEEYGATKASLFKRSGLQFCVVNMDDSFGRKIVESGVAEGASALTVSLSDHRADIYARTFRLTDAGITADVITPWGEETIHSRLVGEFNLANILTAIGCVCGSGVGLTKVAGVIPELTAVEGRMQRVLLSDQYESSLCVSAFVDYAHTPDALERALVTLKQSTPNSLWVVFGCGGDRDKGKRSVMGAIAEKHADKIVITSDNPRSEAPDAIIADIEKGITAGTFVSIPSRQQAIQYALDNADTGDCVLIAGKGHEKYQIIGNEKIFFDDYLIAKTVLEKRYGASSGASI